MFIQTTHWLEFRHEGKLFVSAGNGVPEYAPDWISEDDYFALTKAAKQLTVLSGIPGNQPPQKPADELIDGISIYSWEFPAINYLPGVTEDLYAAIQERLKVGILDFADANRVTLINGQYVRNAVIQQIAEQFLKDLEAPPADGETTTPPEPPKTDESQETAPPPTLEATTEANAPKGRGSKNQKATSEASPADGETSAP